MIKRIKYGCFALLFITTLTLSSIVAILASSSAGLDNSFYLTYESSAQTATMASVPIFEVLTDGNPMMDNGAISSLIFDYYDDDYLAKIESAELSVSVAEDGSDNIMLYAFNVVEVDMGLSAGEVLILSNQQILAPVECDYLCRYCDSIIFNNFNTTNVTSMVGMFTRGGNLTSLDLSGFKTKNVTYMSHMFYECNSLTTIYVGDGWNVENVTSSSSMFDGCSSLVGGNGTTFNSSYTDSTYARIDTAETPGYFTLKTY